ncbi:MAG: HEAT repeat domain-containing protein [Polyangia bacterium]|jgi:HEAT repeat protein|nr:HEAT repeat domain-containing protein [Polyangia bacterium]
MFSKAPTRTNIDAALRDLAHPDPRVRAAAAGALDQSPLERREEVCSALRDALDDGTGDVRYAAALSIRELGDAQAVPRLIDMLEDRDFMARQAAVMALGSIGDPRAVLPLIQALKEGPPDVRFQAVTSLVELEDPRALGALLEALEDRDAEVRASAAAAVGDLMAHEGADAVALLLKDPDPKVSLEAAYALSRLGDDRGIETLCRRASHRDFGFLACEALGRLGNPQARVALRRAWKGLFVHPLTRLRAAASLLQLGETSPREFLIKQSRSRRSEVRGLALELLGELGGAWALDSLLAGLKGRSPDAAARGLGTLGDRSAVPALKKALASAGSDPELSADIEEALGRLESNA